MASINAFGPVYLEKPKPGAKKYDGTEPECQICLELGEKLYNGMCEAVDTNEVTAKINISREVYNRLREANEKSPIWFKGELTPDNYAKAYLVFPPLGYGGL